MQADHGPAEGPSGPGRRGWRAALGLACVVLGAVLATRPFTSLSVLVALVGAAAILTGATLGWAARRTGHRLDDLVAVGWVALGLAVLAWPDLSVRGVALVTGAGMVAAGPLAVARGWRGTLDERLASVLHGAAGVVLGLLALSWPDVTLLVVAVAFGARTVLFGLSELWAAVRGTSRAERRPGRPRRWVHLAGATGALVGAVLLAGASAVLRAGEPVVDGFYDAPGEVPAEPGALLRAERFTREVPEGAVAWRILYTTTRDEGVPALASALVVAPVGPAADPRPVVAWAHGTTGIARTCAPSVLSDPFGSGAFFALDRVLDQGWVLVATDYVGLGTEGPHTYMVGQGEGRAVLDAVRAAHGLDELALDAATVVWGHSQGGHAALWTGVLAAGYAPDVEVRGVAALAPASDLAGLVDGLREMPGGSIFATYVVSAYAATYPEVRVEDYVRPAARVGFEATAGRCLGEPAVFASIVGSLATGWSTFSGDVQAGPLADRLAQNVPTGDIDAPLLIGQGATDPLVRPEMQAAYVEARCARGQPVDYRTYPGRDHVGVVAADSPLIDELVTWTGDRLAGRPATDDCAR